MPAISRPIPSTNTYPLYIREGDGGYTSRWRDQRGGTSEGAWSAEGMWFPPPPAVVVRASSLKQALHFAYDSKTSRMDPFGRGIWWTSEEWGKTPAPLTADCTQWWATLAGCGRGRTIALWPTAWEAVRARRLIDSSGCGGRCWGASGHKIMLLTRAEASKLRPVWVCGPDDEPTDRPPLTFEEHFWAEREGYAREEARDVGYLYIPPASQAEERYAGMMRAEADAAASDGGT